MSPQDPVGLAVDLLVAGGEDEAALDVHAEACASRDLEADCDCKPRHLIVPPAALKDLPWWEHHLDWAARH